MKLHCSPYGEINNPEVMRRECEEVKPIKTFVYKI